MLYFVTKIFINEHCLNDILKHLIIYLGYVKFVNMFKLRKFTFAVSVTSFNLTILEFAFNE